MRPWCAPLVIATVAVTGVATGPPAAGTALTSTPLAAVAPLLPSDVVNLSDWHLTLPIGPARDATQINQPQLATFSDPYFRVDAAGDGIELTAPAGGSTTDGSNYPRSELRETTDNGAREASWSDKGGAVNTMTVSEAAMVLPPVKPQVVVAQIHNASSDVIEVIADGEKPTMAGTVKLGVRFKGKEQKTYLDAAYVLGTRYTLQISATGGHIAISYNGVQKFDFSKAESGLYFKAGAYTQSNPSKGDAPGAYGETVIYSLAVVHT